MVRSAETQGHMTQFRMVCACSGPVKLGETRLDLQLDDIGENQLFARILEIYSDTITVNGLDLAQAPIGASRMADVIARNQQ